MLMQKLLLHSGRMAALTMASLALSFQTYASDGFVINYNTPLQESKTAEFTADGDRYYVYLDAAAADFYINNTVSGYRLHPSEHYSDKTNMFDGYYCEPALMDYSTSEGSFAAGYDAPWKFGNGTAACYDVRVEFKMKDGKPYDLAVFYSSAEDEQRWLFKVKNGREYPAYKDGDVWKVRAVNLSETDKVCLVHNGTYYSGAALSDANTADNKASSWNTTGTMSDWTGAAGAYDVCFTTSGTGVGNIYVAPYQGDVANVEVDAYQLIDMGGSSTKEPFLTTFREGATEAYRFYNAHMNGGSITTLATMPDYVKNSDNGGNRINWWEQFAIGVKTPAELLDSKYADARVTKCVVLYDGQEYAFDYVDDDDPTLSWKKDNPARPYDAARELTKCKSENNAAQLCCREAKNDVADFTQKEWSVDFRWEYKETADGPWIPGAVKVQPTTLNMYYPAPFIENVELVTETGKAELSLEDVSVKDALIGEDKHPVHEAQTAPVVGMKYKVTIDMRHAPHTIPFTNHNRLMPLTLTLKSEKQTKRVDFTMSSLYATIEIPVEDPHNWLDEDWNPIATTLTLSPYEGDTYHANGYKPIPLYDRKETETLNLEATHGGEQSYKPTLYRAKLMTDVDNNDYREFIFMKKTDIDLTDYTKVSELVTNGIDANNDGEYEDYVMLQQNGTTSVPANFAEIDGSIYKSIQDVKHYHRLADLEKDDTLILLLVSETHSGWYNNLYEHRWLEDSEIRAALPYVKTPIFFSGNSEIKYTNAKAYVPAGSVTEDKTDALSHYVMYPPKGFYPVDELDIQTAVDQIEADENSFVDAGVGYADVLADGVSVYDMNGVKVAGTQGRHALPAGVYIAAKGSDAVKIFVK